MKIQIFGLISKILVGLSIEFNYYKDNKTRKRVCSIEPKFSSSNQNTFFKSIKYAVHKTILSNQLKVSSVCRNFVKSNHVNLLILVYKFNTRDIKFNIQLYMKFEIISNSVVIK